VPYELSRFNYMNLNEQTQEKDLTTANADKLTLKSALDLSAAFPSQVLQKSLGTLFSDFPILSGIFSATRCDSIIEKPAETHKPFFLRILTIPGVKPVSLNFATISELGQDHGILSNDPFWLSILSTLFASIGATIRSREEESEDRSTREMVYETIEGNPGIHFRELCRELNRSSGVIQYHLYILERENRIKFFQDGSKFTRYFANGFTSDFFSDHYYSVLSMLQRPSLSKIIHLLRDSENELSRNQLANEIGISLQGVTCNCKKLVANGIIEELLLGRQRFYRLTNNTIEILETLDLSFFSF
ncbi:MAG: winged helix-turn-helix transcriptional regulator, partial [Candidatus Hodarchaeales archaeon]